MQITTQHILVIVLPVIVFFTTFFIAEEYAARKGSKQQYQWNPSKLHLEVLVIMVVGILVSVLLGYLSYAVIFKGFIN